MATSALQEWTEQAINEVKSHEIIKYIAQNSKTALCWILPVALAIWLTTRALVISKRSMYSRPRTPDLEKPALKPLSVKRPAREHGGE
jgi:hypothetical protein